MSTDPNRAQNPAGSPPATPPQGPEPAGSPSPGEATPGAATQPTQQDLWNQTPEPIRKELQEQRRQAGQFSTMKEQLEARGFTVVTDAQGNVHIVDPRPAEATVPAPAGTAAADPLQAAEDQLARDLEDADLADKPEAARAKAVGKYTRAVAQITATGLLSATAPQQNRATVAAFKAARRADPNVGPYFAHAEAEFDRLYRQLENEATKARVPLLITDETLQSLAEMAVGKAMPTIAANLAAARGGQVTLAGQVAGAVSTAPGAVAPAPTGPVTLEPKQQEILQKLAGGAAVAFDKLVKRVTDGMKAEVS